MCLRFSMGLLTLGNLIKKIPQRSIYQLGFQLILDTSQTDNQDWSLHVLAAAVLCWLQTPASSAFQPGWKERCCGYAIPHWWAPWRVLQLSYYEQYCSVYWCTDTSVICAQGKYELCYFILFILFAWGHRFVYMYRCVRTCVSVHLEARGWYWVFCSVVLHFTLRRFLMKLKLPESAWLAGQWATGVSLSFPP